MCIEGWLEMDGNGQTRLATAQMDFITELIQNSTGKSIIFRDRFNSSTGEVWFYDAIFGGESFKVVKFHNTGVIECFKDHPVSQKNPTKTDKIMSRENFASEKIVKVWKRSLADPNYIMCKNRLEREFSEM